MRTIPKITRKFAAYAFALTFQGGLALAQDAPMPGMQMQHQHAGDSGATLKTELPRFGATQKNASGPLFDLSQALQTAKAGNPTFRQAEAGLQAARARAVQARLYPNPLVGYAGDEIRGGETHGGKQGFFVEQTIVTGGKLALARTAAEKEVRLAEIEAEEQELRVQTSVKMAFYRVLAAQELADCRASLAQIAEQEAQIQQGLANTGQADETEVLAARVEAQRARLAARMKENTLREEWRTLAAVMGRPDMPLQTVAGDLEHGWPELSEAEAVDRVAQQSPAVRIAAAAREQANAALARAQREKIPDIVARAGVEYNHESLNALPQAIGWQANAQLAMALPIFNRNQGNVAAERAAIDRAQAEEQRVALTLRDRAATVIDQYANARLMAEQYRDNLLPLARRSYTLMAERHAEMLAAYPRVLETQRKLFELHFEYLGALESVWTTGLELQGFLLSDGLEAPARPGEMDRAIRETNVPMPERLRSPGE